MKWKALKDKEDCSFWSSTNCCKYVSNTIDSVKSAYQKWIISHPHVIHFPIAYDCIKMNFDDGNIGSKTELCQRVLLQVSICELHIDMQNKYSTGFPWHMVKRGLSILVIPLFGNFFQHNQKIQHSAIKICMVEKYSSRLEHTKSLSIIGVNDDYVF